MGDGRELTPRVVAALLRPAPGATAEVVRARLRVTPEGARVVAAAEASPEDAGARAELSAAVARLLATDAAFAQYLGTTELGGAADPDTVRLKTGSGPSTVQLRTKSSPSTVQLRIGGGAKAATRGANLPIITALVLVLVAALVAIGVHLSSRPLLDPGLARDGHSLREPAQLRTVLPDLPALPQIAWAVESGPSSGTGSGGEVPCLLPVPSDGCPGQLAYATETFRVAMIATTRFSVIAFDSPQTAERAFATLLDRIGGPKDATAVPFPQVGDQSAARTHGATGADAIVRTGSVLLHVHDSGSPMTTLTAPTALARMLATRLQQALDGRHPDADVRST
ncbi:hypothetical protein ACIBCA_31160 [Kitasatospora sp. NPDC051170]|uniref:hypothetical protein n=1 Tax=Kitasatospora sp. NPDC051170 TaxID=3364056 RepID=UPI0037915E48